MQRTHAAEELARAARRDGVFLFIKRSERD